MSRYGRGSTIVIGAGPAGLAAADGLRRAGNEVVVLEAREVAASWVGRHERLRLNTDRRTSSLPARPIPRSEGTWVTRDAYVRYLRHVAADLDVRCGVRVRRVDRVGGSWCIQTSDRRLYAETIVVACGHDCEAVIPAWPGRSGWSGEIVHAGRYRRREDYAGRRVLVAGAGTSGLEIAVDLARDATAPVQVAVRTVPTTFPRSFLGVPLTPAARLASRLPVPFADVLLGLAHRATMGDLEPYGLRPRGGVASRLRDTGHGLAVVDGLPGALRSGRLQVVSAVQALESDVVLLDDGTRIPADVVIAATGYSCALEGLVGHLDVLDDRGAPIRRRPGLHFIGYDLPVSGQLSALRRSVRRIVDHTERETRRGEPPIPSGPRTLRPFHTRRSVPRHTPSQSTSRPDTRHTPTPVDR